MLNMRLRVKRYETAHFDAGAMVTRSKHKVFGGWKVAARRKNPGTKKVCGNFEEKTEPFREIVV